MNSPVNPSGVAAGGFKIAIVDDHPMIRQGLKELIRRQEGLSLCWEATDSEETAARLAESKPDLIIFDLVLGKRNALVVLRELKKSANSPKVLVLTLQPEDIYAERAAYAGADGFMNKDASSEEILRAINVILSGGQYYSDTVLEHLESLPAEAKITSQGDALVSRLTERELEVFELLGQGMSAKQIAGELGISPKTVETYQSHLREKLAVPNGAELSRRAILWNSQKS